MDLFFLNIILTTLELEKVNTQAGVPGLNRNDAYRKYIPLPPIEIQNEVVEKINEELAIVEQNRRLIEMFEQKIKDKISEVWGE